MLNEYQRRSLSITLRIIEERLADIELILNKCDDIHILYERKCDIPGEVKEEVLRKTFFAKDRIRIIAENFNLKKSPSKQAGKHSVNCRIVGKFSRMKRQRN